jgi:hypothetical protein
VGEAEEIPLVFKLMSILALLSNYDQENCLINVGTEGDQDQMAGRNTEWRQDNSHADTSSH